MHLTAADCIGCITARPAKSRGPRRRRAGCAGPPGARSPRHPADRGTCCSRCAGCIPAPGRTAGHAADAPARAGRHADASSVSRRAATHLRRPPTEAPELAIPALLRDLSNAGTAITNLGSSFHAPVQAEVFGVAGTLLSTSFRAERRFRHLLQSSCRYSESSRRSEGRVTGKPSNWCLK